MLPTPAEILSASHRLRGIIDRTPLVFSEGLSTIAGTDVYLKCENLQRTGSFKLRGAYNALSTLPAHVRARGVVASSAGNHGLGLAYAAGLLGMRVLIFVPSTAPAVKRDGIRALGAEMDETQPHYDAAQAAAIAYSEANGIPFISPQSGEAILAGQGTIAVEILEELPGLRTVIVPVGGGGLVGGIATMLRATAPRVRIVGAQSDRTNAMAVALDEGRIVDVDVPPTLADGLSGQVDELAFAIGRFAIDEMRVVSEEQIAYAIARMARDHGMRVEGSGSVAVATILSRVLVAPRGPVAVVVSGSNIDEARWRAITAESSAPTEH